jgi:alpha-amylase/alpha-mannosidase (GH57 family)
MPRAYLCFLWHMHQPFYKDLISGEYHMPWTRLHALKDYYGMVKMLERFPRIHQTFNLVPSLVMQVAEYAGGEAREALLQAVLAPAEELRPETREFLLRNSFYAHPIHMIGRYPRYAELYAFSEGGKNAGRAGHLWSARDIRDVQVLSQLAWFDEEVVDSDPEVKELAAKGRDFSIDDQQLMGRKQREILGLVLPAYRSLAASGQIEISTTPFYHPILPLLCDSDIAAASHPGLTLPTRFSYPEDARRQLQRAREFIESDFGAPPAGLWPSEGSVSDQAFEIASDLGFRWAATDSGVLSRTLGHSASVDEIYRPYVWRQDGRQLQVIFRDHFLSDLVGFVYSRMDAREAAADLLKRIRENCRGPLDSGRDVLVPIILDGENAWEYYDRNGRPFLSELYRLISEDETLTAATVSEALSRLEPRELQGIFPGSWINANFDIWIGAAEDNRAWELLLRARQAYDASASNVPEKDRALALEELFIAEGSDWCWWYGPEHESAHREDFDQLFRSHLANVYRALHIPPPEDLSRPILTESAPEFHLLPTAHIHPVLDGEVTSYFEWMGAGHYRIEQRSGAMHAGTQLVRDLFYGTDGSALFLRLDLSSEEDASRLGAEARCVVEADQRTFVATVRLSRSNSPNGEGPVHSVAGKVVEVGVTLGERMKAGLPVRFQISLWRDGLPSGAIPRQGWLQVSRIV